MELHHPSSDHGDQPEISCTDVVTLTAWMAEHGYTASEVAYAVEKPWKHTDWLATA